MIATSPGLSLCGSFRDPTFRCPSQNLVRGQFSLIEEVGSSLDTAEEKVREAVVAARKVFTNKKWCKWAADEWLSGAGRTPASAESVAKEMARHAPKATAAGRLSSRGAMLKSPAGKAALAAAIVARSASDEIDPFG